ncbi:MAG: PorV/PorQ family protein [Elusimicrobiota bacterium]|nr:PorV/PorQ family protein [Elusimicrobiota bacterium]
MRKSSHLLFLLLAALLLPGAGARAAGSASGSFLRVGWGARPAAMGEAFTAAADDVDALYWNPAGLNYVKRLQQTFGHNSWIEGLNVEHAAFAVRSSTVSVIGAGAFFLNAGDIERGNKYGYTEGYYSANDLAVIFSYARRLKPRLAAGVNLKVIRERIESASAQAFAADAGVIYEASRKLKLGFTVQNLGTGLTFNKTACPLPLGLRAGAALQVSTNMLITSDISLPLDDSLGLHLGTEYIYPSVKGVRLALRAGVKSSAMSYLGATSAITLGFGAEVGAVGLDYALSPYGDLGMSHRLGLKIKFDLLTSKTEVGEITVVKDGAKVKRNAAEVYKEAMLWFSGKTASEKLSRDEQAVILQRIIDKFAPLGVDVSTARQKLGGGNSAPKP